MALTLRLGDRVIPLERPRKTAYWILAAVVGVIAQVYSIWNFSGEKVDESELVLFAVGFLGGDLDPVWDGYGHLGMYLLGLLYYVDGSISVLLGKFSSLLEYASDGLESGRFYILGRMFCSTLIVASLFLASINLERIHQQRLLSITFLAFTVLLPSLVYYANYIRSDTLVAFFTLLVWYFSSQPEPGSHLFKISFCLAAAVACKISALSLLAYLPLFTLFLLIRGQLSFGKAVVAQLVCVVAIYALSPYMNYVELLKVILAKEVDGGAFNLVREEYSTVASRVAIIIDFHISALGDLVCILALLSFISLATDFRRHTIAALALCALSIFPYLLGHTQRNYWFVPTYILVVILAYITVATIVMFLSKTFQDSKLRKPYALGLTVAFAAMVFLSVKAHFRNFVVQSTTRVTNKEQARQWLQKHHLGETPILIDRHFLWVYPQLYDPAYVSVSRKTSRLFTYERDGNDFIAAALEYDLYENSESKRIKPGIQPSLIGLRADFDDSISHLGKASICSYFAKKCFPLTQKQSNDLELSRTINERTKVKITGPDPFMEYEVNRFVSGDGGHYLDIDTDAANVELYYDIGDGYSEDNKSRYRATNRLLTLRHIKRRPWVNLIGVGELPRKKVDTNGRVLFVTSSTSYLRFHRIYKNNLGSPKAVQAKAFIDRYSQITANGPIRRFDQGVGPDIEVYEMPLSLLR
ncbi:MAG: hypothetical protein KTR16_02900 [Acidiferrobacterales bacterium]|nr:hypothetical protein [Acidiferrobacterales bacterium]